MRTCGWEFGDALEALYKACDSIRYADGCEDCPLEYRCLADNTFVTVAHEVPFAIFDEMLDYAVECRDRTDEVDIENEYALYMDERRQIDIEERMIDEEYGY